MQCHIVGAGLLGLTTAWFLRAQGADVCVFDRRDGPGLETSFANGGMLHASQAGPWNEPGIAWRAATMLGREDSALLIRLRTLPAILPWLASFVHFSKRDRYLVNVDKNARLADYSLTVLNEHMGNLSMRFDRGDHGTLKVYRTAEQFADAKIVAQRCDNWNVAYDFLDRDGVVALEPALAPISERLVGGIHFPGDISGDAHLYCVELAKQCVGAGVEFRYGAKVDSLDVKSKRYRGVRVDGATLAP